MRIGDTLRDGISEIVAFLPNLIGFLLLLLIGFIVAKLVSAAVRKLLEKTGVDDKIKNSDANRYVDAALPGATVSGGIAKVVFWLIFVFFLFSAIGALRIPALTGFMNQVLAYLPNVIAAILIFVVAALVSSGVGAGVTKVMGDTPTGKIVATIVPALVMVIAMFMILEQLKIAPEIVRIAFGAVMFALALGLALAFGLGGRSVAERLLEDAYRKGQEHKDQARRDMETAEQRGEQQVSAGESGQSSLGASSTTTTSFSTRRPGEAGADG
jgi:small-conductance mechanosensitive channel